MDYTGCEYGMRIHRDCADRLAQARLRADYLAPGGNDAHVCSMLTNTTRYHQSYLVTTRC